MFDLYTYYLGKLYDDLVERQTADEITEEQMESKMDDLRELPVEDLKKKYEALVRKRK